MHRYLVHAVFVVLFTSEATAADYRSVTLIEVANQGTQQQYDTVPVELSATFAGPIRAAIGSIPDNYRSWVSFAVLPPNWAGSKLAEFGLWEPVTALIHPDDARRVFELEPGAQIVVQGEFRVRNTPPIPAAEFNPYMELPPDNPYILVDDLWDPKAEARSEAERKAQADARREQRKAADARRARLDSGDTALSSSETGERATLIKKTRKMLDEAGIKDERVRRQMVDRALEDAGFPALKDGE